MDWFGKHISLWNNAYNCTMNDPMAYIGKHGWRFLIARLQYAINRRVLKHLLANPTLPKGVIV